MSSKDIREAANAHGQAWRTVVRAKQALGIQAMKDGFAAGWTWRLPEAKDANFNAEECQQSEPWHPSQGDR